MDSDDAYLHLRHIKPGRDIMQHLMKVAIERSELRSGNKEKLRNLASDAHTARNMGI